MIIGCTVFTPNELLLVISHALFPENTSGGMLAKVSVGEWKTVSGGNTTILKKVKWVCILSENTVYCNYLQEIKPETLLCFLGSEQRCPS